MTTAKYPDHMDRNEAKVIDCLIRDALALGCAVSVFDGEEWSIKNSTDYPAITAQIAATDITTVRVTKKIDPAQPQVATFMFVHGNAPSEVLADMTDTPFARSLIIGAEACANALEARGL